MSLCSGKMVDKALANAVAGAGWIKHPSRVMQAQNMILMEQCAMPPFFFYDQKI